MTATNNQVKVVGAEEHSICDSFEDMELHEELLRGIYSCGFEKPSAIQQHALRPILDGRDIIGQAQSGTGKTTLFLIGVLQRINVNKKICQALVLAPTREVALLTQKVAVALGDYMRIQCHACIGGTSVCEDKEQLKRGQHIVIGTPGRVNYMIAKHVWDTRDLAVLVLDEADEIFSCGFKDEVYDIFQSLPSGVQVCLFSATMPKDILDLTTKFMRDPVQILVSLFSATMPKDILDLMTKFLRDPVQILVKKAELTLEGIQQFYVAIDKADWKLDTLCDLYETLLFSKCIVYCNTRHRAECLAKDMRDREFTVSVMHADLNQEERHLVMQELRSGSTCVLISTDALTRGIDVQPSVLVINYDLPRSIENYLHRIGRSGRFGRKGAAINFVSGRDVCAMRAFEKHYAIQIEELPADIADRI